METVTKKELAHVLYTLVNAIEDGSIISNTQDYHDIIRKEFDCSCDGVDSQCSRCT